MSMRNTAISLTIFFALGCMLYATTNSYTTTNSSGKRLFSTRRQPEPEEFPGRSAPGICSYDSLDSIEDEFFYHAMREDGF